MKPHPGRHKLLLLLMTISVWSVQEWQCSGGMCMTVPSPRKLALSLPVTLPCSLVSELCFSRFHLFAVLISGKLHIRQSNLHGHNQWNIWITADCWLLFICEGRKDRERSYLSVNVLLIFSSAGGTSTSAGLSTSEIVIRLQTLLLFNI